ncbi:integrase arm-type DNA-binding domain-containing protein [Xanthobacter sp. TB0139]|uniref:integrase arm-type DNA-binding domain-containing protein n=1 Tax=Xanthobacter sp. TB0139 TaxID=3459178 RepID=UPI004039D62B
MPLTDTQIRKAKPADRLYRLTDGGGLFLAVTPAGGKIWRLRYEIEGKEETLVLGPYPDIGRQEAREARVAQKRLLREVRPVVMLLTEGQMSDDKGARILFQALPRVRVLIADKGYDSAWFRKDLEAEGIMPCIPSSKSRRQPYPYDRTPYRQRHQVENLFAKLKDGGASRHATTDAHTPSSPLSASQQP